MKRVGIFVLLLLLAGCGTATTTTVSAAPAAIVAAPAPPPAAVVVTPQPQPAGKYSGMVWTWDAERNIVTFYDAAGKVVWVNDGYVEHALLPETPQPFAVALRSDLAPQVQSYRVTVNQYSLNRRAE